MSKKEERLQERIRESAAEFLNKESNQSSLITVTRVELSSDGRRAFIFITVFPEEKEAEGLSFARRKRTELRERILKDLDIARPPFLEVLVDAGEKNRQRIDILSRR
jgi:ribosome-binding factor A